MRSVRKMSTRASATQKPTTRAQRSASNRSTRSSRRATERATELTKNRAAGKRGNQSSTNSSSNSSSSISNSISSSSSSSSSNSSSSCAASIAPYEWTCSELTDDLRRCYTHRSGQPATLPILVPGQCITVCTSFLCINPPYWRKVQIAEILPKESIRYSPLVLPVGLPYGVSGRSLTSRTEIIVPGIKKCR